MRLMLRKFWTRQFDRHAPEAPPEYPDAAWERLLVAVEQHEPARDVEAEVSARCATLAAPLTDPIEVFAAELDLLSLPVLTGTLRDSRGAVA